jgi:hypothetical protein
MTNISAEHRREHRYKRLPGSGPRTRGLIASPFSRSLLYRGDDHILSVDNHCFSEDYKRFYFSDIQAIITRKTRRGTIWNIVLAFILASSLTTALFLENEYVRIFSWSLSGAFLCLLMINIFRGPTCICHILTAVQEDELPSLNRLRVARRVIGLLKPAIEKAQGTLTLEEINKVQAEVMTRPSPARRGSRQLRAGIRQVRHDEGTLHLIAFAFVLLDGLLIGITLFQHTPTLTALSYILGLLYSIFIVIALARQYGSDIPGAVRRMAWASLGFIIVSSFLGYILMIFALTRQQFEKGMVTQWDMYRALIYLSPQDSPPLLAVHIFLAACSLALGGLGLLRVIRHRRDSGAAAGVDRIRRELRV